MDARDRRHPLIRLDLDQVRELLRGLMGVEELVGIELIERGFSSTNYRLARRSAEPWHLRFVPSGREVCEKEVAIQRALAGRVAVPRIHVSRPDGEPWPFYLGEWVAGTPLDELFAATEGSRPLEDPEGLGSELAETLLAIHAVEFELEGDLAHGMRVVPWPELLPWMDPNQPVLRQFVRHFLFDTPCRVRVGESRAAAIWKRLEEVEAALLPHAPRHALVHSDFNPKNLLVRREEGAWIVSAVLDWEFALAGDPLMDLGNLLRQRANYDERFVAAFVEAYESRATWLPADWRARCPMLELTSAVESLSSAHDRPGAHGQAHEIIERFLT